ncbi:MAG: hypothetical protein PVF49_12150 [Anaerolineales bacterium]
MKTYIGNNSVMLQSVRTLKYASLFGMVILLAACGSLQVDIEQDLPPSQSLAATEPDTPVVEPSEPAPTHDSNGGVSPGPDLVWAPYAAGSGSEGLVVVVDDGTAGFAPTPVDFQLYFDYSPVNGRLAYASQFWHAAQGSNQGVTDLWVYDYGTGQSTQLLSDGLGRAAWSPSGEYLAAVTFNPSLGMYELGLMGMDGSMEILASCVSPSFSWSPDGNQIAYEAGGGIEDPPADGPCQGIYIIDLTDRSVVKISDPPPSIGGWHGDRPIWAEGQEALLMTFASPESVFAVVPLDGFGAYAVSKSDTIEIDYLPNPLQTVWSQEYNSLVGQTEGQFDPHGVWVYQFSEDMQRVQDAYRVTIDGDELDLILIGWWEPGQSVLLRDITNISAENPFGRALVYSLADRSWFEVPPLPNE